MALLFSDNFNRSDGLVENGWIDKTSSSGTPQYYLIQSNTLSMAAGNNVVPYPGNNFLYRSQNFKLPITIRMNIYNGNSSSDTGRYDEGFGLSVDTGTSSAKSPTYLFLSIGKSGANWNNSSYNLRKIENNVSTTISSSTTSNQFSPGDIIEFTLNSNMSAVVKHIRSSSTLQTFNISSFTFPYQTPYFFAYCGPYDARGGNDRMNIDNFEFYGVPATIFSTKDNSGIWKQSSEGFIKISGLWKNIDSIYVKNSGVWKSV